MVTILFWKEDLGLTVICELLFELMLLAGDQIRDPWERSHKKDRSKDKELLSLTLGAELQKARKSTNEDRRQRRRQGTTSPVSSASRGYIACFY